MIVKDEHVDIEAAVCELLSITLGRRVLKNEDVIRKDEAKWDSLNHVELIFMLEDLFGVRFSEKKMAELDSLHSIVEAIGRQYEA